MCLLSYALRAQLPTQTHPCTKGSLQATEGTGCGPEGDLGLERRHWGQRESKGCFAFACVFWFLGALNTKSSWHLASQKPSSFFFMFLLQQNCGSDCSFLWCLKGFTMEKAPRLVLPLCRPFTGVELAPALPRDAIPALHTTPLSHVNQNQHGQKHLRFRETDPSPWAHREGEAPATCVSFWGTAVLVSGHSHWESKKQPCCSQSQCTPQCLETFIVSRSLCSASGVNSGGKSQLLSPTLLS